MSCVFSNAVNFKLCFAKKENAKEDFKQNIQPKLGWVRVKQNTVLMASLANVKCNLLPVYDGMHMPSVQDGHRICAFRCFAWTEIFLKRC